eukprot:5933211-Prymnesium_polylepis.1
MAPDRRVHLRAEVVMVPPIISAGAVPNEHEVAALGTRQAERVDDSLDVVGKRPLSRRAATHWAAPLRRVALVGNAVAAAAAGATAASRRGPKVARLRDHGLGGLARHKLVELQQPRRRTQHARPERPGRQPLEEAVEPAVSKERSVARKLNSPAAASRHCARGCGAGSSLRWWLRCRVARRSASCNFGAAPHRTSR